MMAAFGPWRRGLVSTTRLAPTKSVGRRPGEGGYGVDLMDSAGSSTDRPWVRVQSYSPRGFRVSGVLMEGSVVLLPHAAFLWSPRRMDEVTHESLAFIPLLDPPIDVVLIGCGRRQQELPSALRLWLAERRVGVEAHTSANACATFNFLNQEGRRVLAALLPLGEA